MGSRFIGFILFLCIGIPLFCPSGFAAPLEYDLVYAWNKDLNSILDYKDQLDNLFDPSVSKQLKVVKKGDEYGVIYDCNAPITTILKTIVKHGTRLQQAGFDQPFAIQNKKGYHQLFNVSYGYGPNLDAMIIQYQKVYSYLGKSVGKDLYIEEDEKGNYMLVYRRHGDRFSTLTVAKRHGRLLKSRKIKTAIAEVQNNTVVYGESTLLHGQEVIAQKEQETKQRETAKPPAQPKPSPKPDPKPSDDPVTLHPGNYKVAVNKHSPQPTVKRTAKHPSNRPLAALKLNKGSNSSVEKKVEAYIKGLRRKGKLRGDERTGWMVYDLNRDVSLVDINADQSFQAASMIKPFVALAFFHKVKQGKLKYGPKSRKMMTAMIQRSSNTATNWVMKRVGGPASCQRLLTKQYGSLFEKLQIVEYIPRGGRTYRNKALPSDYVRFLRALWKNKLPYSKEIRRLMALPGRDRLYYGTPIPQGTLVYNKTGTTAHLCGDMGILAPRTTKSSRYPYAIVGIIERSSRAPNYQQWMRSRGGVIREVSTLVYKDLKRTRALK